MEERIVLGIDLGTTNSCVAVWRNNQLTVIPDEYGNKTTPSVVSFTDRTKYIGKEAKNQTDINPENSFYEFKRLMGQKITDVVDQDFFTYKLERDSDNNVLLKTNLADNDKFKQYYTPEEMSSIILSYMRNIAERHFNRKIIEAVITVPAYFNDAQRQATKDAAKIAGLDCLRIIHEPTAAALAYGLEKSSKLLNKDIHIIVYDLGGGTLDVSLLNISDGVFQVLASAGNVHLGGADFDNRLVRHCMDECKLDKISALNMQKLKGACETAKKILSVCQSTTICVKELNLKLTITRQQFEVLCKDLFVMCLKSVDDVLTLCNKERSEIDEIILTGGSTRMPTIKENLKLFFGKEPNCSLNPDEVVAAGAAIEGYILTHEQDPFSENVTLLDIIPLSLGVETIGGVMTVIIPRNSAIPIKRKKKFTTDSDYETTVKIKIFEGERSLTKDNFLVGEFELTGLVSAPRGVAQIEVTFSVDINGIINVSAEDLKNNNKNSILVSGNKSRLSEDRIQELILEAQNMEEKDKLQKEKKQLFYAVEDLCSNIITNLKNPEVKFSEKDKEIINKYTDNILCWLKEKAYYDRDKKEYHEIIAELKSKYGTLVLKINNDNDNFKNRYEKLDEGTYIYDNKEEEGESNNNNNLRDTLIDLCQNVINIISSKIMAETTELKYLIDDTLLWVHVKENITDEEYIQKIEEVNKRCDQFAYLTEISKKDELRDLCTSLATAIETKLILLQKEDLEKLENKLAQVAAMIDTDLDDAACDAYMAELNDLCNELSKPKLNSDNIYGTVLNRE
jgi:heat shock 70kDa protein 1/2/6/8